MSDLIDRQAAINALINLWADMPFGNPALTEIKECVERVPSAQPEKRTEKRTETHACDLISRQAAIDAIEKMNIPEDMCVFEIVSHIELEIATLPSAQPERKKGKWIQTNPLGRSDNIVCDQCGHDSIAEFIYCPNCGADMRGEK